MEMDQLERYAEYAVIEDGDFLLRCRYANSLSKKDKGRIKINSAKRGQILKHRRWLS